MSADVGAQTGVVYFVRRGRGAIGGADGVVKASRLGIGGGEGVQQSGVLLPAGQRAGALRQLHRLGPVSQPRVRLRRQVPRQVVHHPHVIGLQPQRLILDSLRRFAGEVMPALKSQ